MGVDDEPRVTLTVGLRDVAALFGQAIPIEPDDELRCAKIAVRCDCCGAEHATTAAPVFDTHDDDHYGRLELWSSTKHAVRCGCGANIEVVLGHTETRNLLTGGRTLTCDGVRERRGGNPV